MASGGSFRGGDRSSTAYVAAHNSDIASIGCCVDEPQGTSARASAKVYRSDLWKWFSLFEESHGCRAGFGNVHDGVPGAGRARNCERVAVA